MPKRFTDTEKWKDDWFLELEPMMKILWIFILDNCDCAGVWRVNFKLASFSVGTILDKQSALKAFGSRVKILNGEKWLVEKFISFQYPNGLSPKSNVYKGIKKSLDYNGIEIKGYLRVHDDSEVDLKSCPDHKDTDKDTVKDTDKENGIKNTNSASEIAGLKVVRITPDEVVDLWNQSLARGDFKSVPSLGSGTHLKNCLEAIKWLPTGEDWVRLFAKVKASKFLSGENPRGWIVPLTWLVDYDNALRVLASEFDDGCSDPFANMKTKDVPA